MMYAIRVLTLALTLIGITHRAACGDDLVERLQPLQSALGTREIEATWKDGTALWARTERTLILGGKFIESRTWVRDGDGPLYLRYHVIIGPGASPDTFDTYTFSFDGTLKKGTLVLQTEPDGAVLTNTWSLGESRIRETITLPTEIDAPEHWNVWAGRGDVEDHIMEGVWRHVAQSPDPLEEKKPLRDELGPLQQYRGNWEVNTHWADGRALWARTMMRAAPGGQFLHATVLSADDRGPRFHRYQTFYVTSDDGTELREIMFTYHGDVLDGHLIVDPDDPTILRTYIEAQDEGAPRIIKTCHFTKPDRMHWTVDAHVNSAPIPQQIVTGIWHRTSLETPMTQSIDPTLFVASGMDLRQFTLESVINAPVARVYAAFADGDAFPKAFSPQRDAVRADIDLAIGGRYEWIWGDVGSNGCQVLSYIPDRMISFTWNAPPEQPESRALRTWVVVEFSAANNDETHVTLTHLGFGTEPHWDETFEYFQGAWAFVLDQFKANLE